MICFQKYWDVMVKYVLNWRFGQNDDMMIIIRWSSKDFGLMSTTPSVKKVEQKKHWQHDNEFVILLAAMKVEKADIWILQSKLIKVASIDEEFLNSLKKEVVHEKRLSNWVECVYFKQSSQVKGHPRSEETGILRLLQMPWCTYFLCWVQSEILVD